MLLNLRIRHFAIVDSLDIAFDPGLTVFTGETGAGKTILVEAIRFLLGGKVASEMIRTGADACSVEAEFDVNGRFVLRREMAVQGTSRAFLDDRQLSRPDLLALGEQLTDFCGQHQQQVLLDPLRHAEWLDRFSGATELVARVGASWSSLSDASFALAEAASKLERHRRDEELRRFQIAEIRTANVSADEEERLKSEATVLKHSRRLAEAAEMALNALAENEQSVESTLGRLRREAGNCANLDPRWSEIASPLSSAIESVSDAVFALSRYRDTLSFDPQRADQIESRLAEIYRLKTKYGGSVVEILKRLRELEADDASDRQLEDQLKKLEKEKAALETDLSEQAQDLTRKRLSSAGPLEKAINAISTRLGMAKARIKVDITPYDNIHEDGAEQIRFLFEANPAEGFKLLHKIASGGELSRLLLAFKSANRKSTPREGEASAEPPLHIFDEIDSGIGGQTAHAVAREIKSLSRTSQVFLITHLQQLANVADSHYRITKKTTAGRARVVVERLSGDDRIHELARMIAGDNLTERTLEFAAELASRAKK